MKEYTEEQDKWLDDQLALSKEKKAVHTVVFQHIPWFVRDKDEEKTYFNIEPRLRRRMLDKFKQVRLRSILEGGECGPLRD